MYFLQWESCSCLHWRPPWEVEGAFEKYTCLFHSSLMLFINHWDTYEFCILCNTRACPQKRRTTRPATRLISLVSWRFLLGFLCFSESHWGFRGVWFGHNCFYYQNAVQVKFIAGIYVKVRSEQYLFYLVVEYGPVHYCQYELLFCEFLMQTFCTVYDKQKEVLESKKVRYICYNSR